MKKEIAAIYCRLSVEDAEKRAAESESIRNQRALLLGYAKKQGWAVYDIYADEDYSGLREDRPAFQRLLADAEERKFSIILCKTQSRFTRIRHGGKISACAVSPLGDSLCDGGGWGGYCFSCQQKSPSNQQPGQ